MMPMQGLSPQDQNFIMKKLNELQVTEMMNTYNGMVDRCFSECVTSFRTKNLDDQETDCAKRCVQKSMAFQTRVGARFAEKNAAKAEAAAKGAQWLNARAKTFEIQR